MCYSLWYNALTMLPAGGRQHHRCIILWVDKKCETTVSPTGKGSTITQTAWQNLYFKNYITILGLSGITLQI